MARGKFKKILKKKEIQDGKETNLEKNDFWAIIIAGASIFLPALIFIFALIAGFIWLFTSFFS